MRTLDRYIVREMIAPFAIALLIFTFVLVMPVIVTMAEGLVANGVPWPVILQVMSTLVPQALGLTIPMAFLIAVLVALSRLSADREVVVMMACGIGPYQLLRPVFGLATLCWMASLWVMLEAIPNAHQHYRELTLQIVADHAETEVRARQFFEDFPDTVLYVRDTPESGGWKHVFAAHISPQRNTDIYVAERGRMVVDPAQRRIEMALENGVRHTTRESDPTAYELTHFEHMVVALNPDGVFPRGGPAREERDMTIAELQARRAELEGRGSPAHNAVIEIHKKFSVPAACFVFALIGAGLGLSNRRDRKLGSFIVGVLVIFGYYVLMYTAHAAAKGAAIPAASAMWVPNVVFAALGAYLMWSRAHRLESPARVAIEPLQRAYGQRDAAIAPARGHDRLARVIRIPELRVPRPRLLDIYVTRLYVRVLTIAVGGLLSLFYLSSFIDVSDKWFKGQAELHQILSYIAWSTPQYLFYVLAIAVMLATLVTIGLLAKSSELIAMHACGVSVYRNVAPLVVLAGASSMLLFTIQDWVLPTTNRRAAYLRHIISGNPAQTFDVLSNRKWLTGSHDEIYHYDYFDPARKELNRLSVFELDEAGGVLRTHVYVNRATHLRDTTDAAGHWNADQGWRREFTAAGPSALNRVDASVVRLEPAQYFITEAPVPDRMDFVELRTYIQSLSARGYSVVEYQVALHRKVAFPFVTLIMTLIAVPFAITIGKRGAMYGVGIGVALALVYWTLISVFAALGVAGVFPPVIAAWSPNLLFASAATYFVLTVRT